MSIVSSTLSETQNKAEKDTVTSSSNYLYDLQSERPLAIQRVPGTEKHATSGFRKAFKFNEIFLPNFTLTATGEENKTKTGRKNTQPNRHNLVLRMRGHHRLGLGLLCRYPIWCFELDLS